MSWTPHTPRLQSRAQETILPPAGEATDRLVTQLGVIEPSAWFERAIAGLLLAANKRRLRAIVAVAYTTRPQGQSEAVGPSLSGKGRLNIHSVELVTPA